MNHTYETMLLLDNREVKKGWDTLKSEVAGLFTKHGSEVVSARRWDERRLAYPIKGQQRATYLLMYHSSATDSIPAINRELQYAEPVLRSLTLVCEEIPEEAHQPEAEFDESAVPIDEDPPVVEAAPAEEAEEAPKAEGEASAEAEASSDAPADGDAAPEADAPAEADKTDEETKQ